MTATVTRRFDSLSAIIDYAAMPLTARASREAQNMMRRSRNAPDDADWYGMTEGAKVSPNQYAADMLTNGWKEGVERMQAAIQAITPPPSTNARRRSIWSDAGDSLDMQRVYSGQLDSAWRTCTRQSARAPRPVTIWLPMALPSISNQAVIFWRGAAVSVLADALQHAGYSVAVMGYMNGQLSTPQKGDNRPDVDFSLTIKPHRSPMDLGTLAAATALPAMVRAVYYSALIIAGSVDGHQIKDGLIFKMTDCEYADMQPNDIGGARTVSTQADAQRWIAESMEKLTEQTTN